MSFSQNHNVLLRNPVEEAKLNNCSIDTLFCRKIGFRETQCTGV